MLIRFLATAKTDLIWMRQYYTSVFPQGDDAARKHYQTALSLLVENPYMGRPSEANEGARELVIANTPFTFIYRINQPYIDILRLWDQRQDQPPV
ncbi:MAG: type II toxin-antitoxin system RelE/ParE family toxin [Gammaproteobacteria bacterium]|nr:type II toxin-antitoxin system RelE/ParE family toxin [Gammaproteobacteria bacterium]